MHIILPHSLKDINHDWATILFFFNKGFVRIMVPFLKLQKVFSTKTSIFNIKEMDIWLRVNAFWATGKLIWTSIAFIWTIFDWLCYMTYDPLNSAFSDWSFEYFNFSLYDNSLSAVRIVGSCGRFCNNILSTTFISCHNMYLDYCFVWI